MLSPERFKKIKNKEITTCAFGCCEIERIENMNSVEKTNCAFGCCDDDN